VPCAVRKLAVCRHAMPRPLGFALRTWRRLAALVTGQGGSPQFASG
jgi:hypothetical protein